MKIEHLEKKIRFVFSFFLRKFMQARSLLFQNTLRTMVYGVSPAFPHNKIALARALGASIAAARYQLHYSCIRIRV